MNPRVLQVIGECDVIIEVVDARFPETRCPAIERAAKKRGKTTILVKNKADLVKKCTGLCVSAKTKKGLRYVRTAIGKASGKKAVKVGVVGYANTGKSSLISALRGRASARSSSTAGFTKGVQWIKLSDKVMLLDSPGEIPRKESKTDLVLKGALDVTKIKDAEGAAMDLITKLGSKKIAKAYTVEQFDDEWEQLEELAGKWLMLKKGAQLNTDRAARKLLKDWQTGKLKA